KNGAAARINRPPRAPRSRASLNSSRYPGLRREGKKRKRQPGPRPAHPPSCANPAIPVRTPIPHPTALKQVMEMRAFVFPGQGSQFVGMGKDLQDAFPAAREVFEEVDDALGQKLSKLMFEGPESDLNLTENTQPAL